MDWTPILTAATTGLFGLLVVLLPVMLNKQNKHAKQHDKTEDEIKQALEFIQSLKTGQKEIKDELRNNSYATKKQIKYTLTRLHREATSRGFLSRYELECAEDLYTEYKRLGGNSFIDKVMEELRNLPIKFAEFEQLNV
jgi:hypothetical protein